jgi:hypothetical protein
MWPFRSKIEPLDTTERLERLEKAMKRMQEDWTETYGKFRTLQLRVAKQVQRAEELAEAEADGKSEEPGEGVVEIGGMTHTTLTPRQRQLQDQILLRRRGTGR